MDFIRESCPYCGGAVSFEGPDGEPAGISCPSCGRKLHPSRAEDIDLVYRSDESLLPYEAAMNDAANGNLQGAMQKLSDMVEAGDESPILHIVRALVHTAMKEDGKALADWKAGIAGIDDSADLDAFVRMMARRTSEMVISDEIEFREFDPLQHIDRLAEALDERTGFSCKGYMYTSVLIEFLAVYEGLSEDDRETCEEVLVLLLKRVAVYCRELSLLRSLIGRILKIVDYSDDTYDDDDNFVLHVFYTLDVRLADLMMAPESSDYPSGWTDADMKASLEGYLDAILACTKNTSAIDKYMKRRTVEVPLTVEEAVDDYAQRYLRIIVPGDPQRGSSLL